MNIVTWNLNGLTSSIEPYTDISVLLETLDADIICFQEIKMDLNEKFANLQGWDVFYDKCTIKKGFAGVATYCSKKATPCQAVIGIQKNEEQLEILSGRCVITDHGDFVLINAYFPTGLPTSQTECKAQFRYAIWEIMEEYRVKGRAVILCADLNFAFQKIDHSNPDLSLQLMGLTTWESHRGRAWLNQLFENQIWVDVFRKLNPQENGFTTGKKYFVNYKLRSDYIICDQGSAQHFQKCQVLQQMQGSDHFPVWAMLDFSLSWVSQNPPQNCFNLQFQVKQDNKEEQGVDSKKQVCISSFIQKREDFQSQMRQDLQQFKIKKKQKLNENRSVQKIYNSHASGKKKIVQQISSDEEEEQQQINQNKQTFDSVPKISNEVVKAQKGKLQKEWNKILKDVATPMCQHQEPSQLNRVSKDGKNKGRWFYCCKKPKGTGTECSCGFFQWADEEYEINPICSGHSEPTKLLTTQNGANKGRKFYVCSRSKEEQCKFFLWADKKNS